MNNTNNLQRSLSWTVGLSVSLGVPLLIIPSIEYFSKYSGYFAITIWFFSVIQGFIQNTAYGELAVDFPNVSGIPGYAQHILGRSEGTISSFMGGFCAWGYWFAWAPMPSIFIISISDLIVSLFPYNYNIPSFITYLVVGTLIMSVLFCINKHGLSTNAIIGYIINCISIGSLLIISIAPFINGSIEISNINFHNLLNMSTISCNEHAFILLFGIFGMAQWSACAWETAAIYGPEYKNPSKDTYKALISCGLICLIIFPLVQLSCIESLGVDQVNTTNTPVLLLLSEFSFGKFGSIIASFAMILAMFSIIQTGFSGSSRALYSMAYYDNLPKSLSKLNTNGVPQNAMIFIIIINFIFLVTGSSTALVSASSVGYCFANGICLTAYIKHKIEKNRILKSNHKGVILKYWYILTIPFAIMNLSIFVFGLLYLNYKDYGKYSLFICTIMMLLYIPLNIYTKKKIHA